MHLKRRIETLECIIFSPQKVHFCVTYRRLESKEEHKWMVQNMD